MGWTCINRRRMKAFGIRLFGITEDIHIEDWTKDKYKRR